MRVGRLPLARFDVPGRTEKRFARRYVHAAQSFLEGLTLRAGRPHRFDLTLRPTRELLSMDDMRGRRNPDRSCPTTGSTWASTGPAGSCGRSSTLLWPATSRSSTTWP